MNGVRNCFCPTSAGQGYPECGSSPMKATGEIHAIRKNNFADCNAFFLRNVVMLQAKKSVTSRWLKVLRGLRVEKFQD